MKVNRSDTVTFSTDLSVSRHDRIYSLQKSNSSTGRFRQF